MMPDWFRIILDLERADLTDADIAKALKVSRATICNWKQGASPRYDSAISLLALHAQYVEVQKTESS